MRAKQLRYWKKGSSTNSIQKIENEKHKPLLLSPPPTINQFSPTVAPACPARAVGISPCWVGLDHSIYKITENDDCKNIEQQNAYFQPE